jgi:hypothetical protein
MDKELAWAAITAAFSCGAELQNLLQRLKQGCDAETYKQFAVGIATAIDTINVEVIDRALKKHPDLERRIEADLGGGV